MPTAEEITRETKSKWILIMIPFAFIVIAALGISLSVHFNSNDINISVSDDDDELEVSAQFPPAKTSAVHEYLRSQFDLSDLSDLNSVVIKKYQTPDDLMTVSLRSRPGYVKIVLDKHRNSKEAYLKLKSAGEGIKQVLIKPQHKSLSYEPLFYGRFFFLSLT